MIDKRKNFLINSAYVALWLFLIYGVLRFASEYLMPFIFGFVIAFTLKPIVRKLNTAFGENKIASIIVIVLFYVLILLLLTWLVIGVIALVQHYIPIVESYISRTILPMAMEMFEWVENLIGEIDPRISGIIAAGLDRLAESLQGILQVVSATMLTWVTNLLTSTPRLMLNILIAVISSFFFSIDYQLIVNTVLDILPKRASYLLMESKNLLGVLLGKYAVAYAKLLSLTFVELSIGFLILRVNNPILLAAAVSLVDILPVLGTGTILIPWAIYELILGTFSLGIGLFILYIIVMVVRNTLEPRVIGKQIGLHPILTLVSIFAGMKMWGFWGLFVGPLMVTVLKTLHDEDKLNFVAFFKGEETSLEE